MANEKLYIDIFAGCGGLSTGLLNAGWTGLFAIEKNADAFATLKYNLIDNKEHFRWPKWLPVKECDINVLLKDHMDDLMALRGKVTLVAGGPPCQGFSMAGKRDKNDQRNKLVKSYIKFIKLVLPQVIIFENVHGFTVNFKGKKGTKQYSSYVERALRRLGYKTMHQIVDMSEYGVPQNRKRFILVAMRDYFPKDVFETLARNKDAFCLSKGISCTTSIKDAISDLEQANGSMPSPDTKGFMAGTYGPEQSGYQRLMRSGIETTGLIADSHRFVNHRKNTIKLHKELLEKAPVGKRITPSDNIVENLNRRGVTVLDANAQAPTVTSIPDELVHYKEPRILTVREHARIQSFPDWFEFKGQYTSGGKRRKQEVPRYTQVGNAVPPLFAEQVGLAILEVLSHEQPK
ncbi:DNA cytosine methyltransferase [Faecalibacterium prausnitzii]|mgnify:FL=1|jgi:DNA (cytosine-5)-methyltransferase 1|uniref:DNA cytosine methyltransferase n=1 Tax=Faecalibacterium prausnitzii TaxID=853 RepID=UPI001CBFE523|nr:DNA cytosine methyltransferase [Faecalibacterium prausnitzii]